MFQYLQDHAPKTLITEVFSLSVICIPSYISHLTYLGTGILQQKNPVLSAFYTYLQAQ